MGKVRLDGHEFGIFPVHQPGTASGQGPKAGHLGMGLSKSTNPARFALEPAFIWGMSVQMRVIS